MSADPSTSELSRAPLTATVSHPRPTFVLCTVTGEIDMTTAPALRVQLAKALQARGRHLVVDLTAVTFLAAAGIHLLDEARRACDDGGDDLTLVGARSQVCKVLDLCRVGCPRYATFEQALADVEREAP